ncbi:hypothetical protein C8F01DRAFT_1243100 [Mycena amicta]|nr:hypothetical protein C8F01DRAFT_1243100 [Mycena amicta]
MATSARISQGNTTMYINYTMLLQSLTFGAYTVLICVSTRILLQRGLRRRSSKMLFGLGILMYSLSAAYWVYSVVDSIARIRRFIEPENSYWMNFQLRVGDYYDLVNAIVVVNFVLSDGIVAWRSWMICRRDFGALLFVPLTFLLFTILLFISLVALQIPAIVSESLRSSQSFMRLVSLLQLLTIGISFLSNLSATALIGAAVWRHRQIIKSALQGKTKVSQVLALLLESGMLYCGVVIFAVGAQFLRLPYGTLCDLCLPVFVHLAGAYAPALMLLLRVNQRGEDDLELLGTIQILQSLHIPPDTVPEGAER